MPPCPDRGWKTMNPLLDFSALPRFSEIQPSHVRPAIEALIAENRALVERLTGGDQASTWEGFVVPLDDANERLSRAWNQVGHLNAVVNSPELREAYNSMLPAVTQYFAELGQDERLFHRFKAIRESAQFVQLSPAQQQALENQLRDFRLGGAELPADKKTRLLTVQEELAMLSSRFNDNVLDATNDFALYIDDEHQLSGIPDDVKQTAREAAASEGKSAWKLTLHAPCHLPVMQYADSRPLRETMYRAHFTRASELSAASRAKDWDNTGIIRCILALRAEVAALLGFRTYAEVSLATKMVKMPAQVTDFIRQLVARAKPFAEKDMAELAEFARATLNLAEVEAWDIPYLGEKLRAARYAFSDNEVKQYFPENAVVPGMFRVVEALYGISIRESTAATWHPAVRFFEITDGKGQTVGQFYLDLYARQAKRGGAWMDAAINRRCAHGRLQIPVAYLTCNFSAPLANRPALFTHDEVITLFHEFGHGLHQLLTQVDELSVSGINGVEWDAVELPSQFMENFCWEWDVLRDMSSEVDSHAPLPRALFDKMLAAKNFESGMQFVRQLEFALFDMLLHTQFDPDKDDMQQLLAEVRREVAVVMPPACNRFPNQFGHIFGGGYAAGYYSYKWAEVLSADAYSAFEEKAAQHGVLNREVGERFRTEVLGAGGSRPALQSFVAFRGREPNIDALIRHNGMTAELKVAA
jgi:oligopeptidase A